MTKHFNLNKLQLKILIACMLILLLGATFISLTHFSFTPRYIVSYFQPETINLATEWRSVNTFSDQLDPSVSLYLNPNGEYKISFADSCQGFKGEYGVNGTIITFSNTTAYAVCNEYVGTLENKTPITPEIILISHKARDVWGSQTELSLHFSVTGETLELKGDEINLLMVEDTSNVYTWKDVLLLPWSY